MRGSQTLTCPAWLEINLSAIADNISNLKSVLGPQREIIAVIKADGYGHGALPVAQVALNSGAGMLAVAFVQEAVELTDAGIETEILILSGTSREAAPTIVEYGFHVPLTDVGGAEALSEAAQAQNRPAKVHIKVDTGMHRLGVAAEDIGEYCEQIAPLPGLSIHGIFTHFASSPTDPQFTLEQLSRFKEAAGQAEAALGYCIPLKHCANSCAIVRYPESWLDAVRPGALIYGIPRNPGGVYMPTMRPAMTLRTTISHVKPVAAGQAVSYGRTWKAPRDTQVALLPVGYADGYSRALSNNADVLLRGQRVPVVGAICMDCTIIDVGSVGGAQVGEKVVMIGQQGEESITIAEIAERCNTVVQEVACWFTRRLPRMYTHEPGDVRVKELAEAHRSPFSDVTT